MWLGVVLIVVCLHVWMNRTYAWCYGRRLKLRYSWAAHGLLLWGRRARNWEVKS